MFCVVYVTAGSLEEGKRIASGLVEEQLAACVNIVPQVYSVYRWQEKIEEGEEVLLIVKTLESLVECVTEWVVANHSYTVPEIIAIPIKTGNEKYLQWIKESVSLPGGKR